MQINGKSHGRISTTRQPRNHILSNHGTNPPWNVHAGNQNRHVQIYIGITKTRLTRNLIWCVAPICSTEINLQGRSPWEASRHLSHITPAASCEARIHVLRETIPLEHAAVYNTCPSDPSTGRAEGFEQVCASPCGLRLVQVQKINVDGPACLSGSLLCLQVAVAKDACARWTGRGCWNYVEAT